MRARAKATTREFALFAILLGLLLGGWGFDDMRGLLSHPARAGYLSLVVAGTIFVALRCPNVDAFRRGNRPVREWTFALWTVFGFGIVFFLPFADRRGYLTFTDANAVRYAGLALAVIGGTQRVRALRVLGKQFSGFVTLQEGHMLVQTGLYSVIRHPMYLGYVLAISGFALVLRSWLVITVLVLGVVFVLSRIMREEKLLAEEFGSEFEAYRRRTWKLIPHVY